MIDATIEPRLSMVFDKLDVQLKARGFFYDPRVEQFFDGCRQLPWTDVTALVPGMTAADLASYRDEKYFERLQERGRAMQCSYD